VAGCGRGRALGIHALAVVRMVLERLVFLYGWHAGNNV